MKKATLLLTFFLFINIIQAQRYFLGDELKPSSSEFKFIGKSSQTGVSNYRYIGTITDNMYGRKIGDITVGVKDNHIALTIYNIIPNSDDIGVPKDIVNLVQAGLSFPLMYKNGVYGVNIDAMTLSLSRTNSSMTFNKDRIMLLTSVKYSLLKN